MGCTPSAQQSQPGTAQVNGNEGEFHHDQNKKNNNCRITRNHSKGKAGCSWRKKTEKTKIPTPWKESDKSKISKRDSCEHGPFNLSNKQSLKVLLAFPKEDNVLDHFIQAVEKLGYEYTSCHSIEAVMSSYVQTGHDIVVLDNRSVKQLDPVTLCRSSPDTEISMQSYIKLGTNEIPQKADISRILQLCDASKHQQVECGVTSAKCRNHGLELKRNCYSRNSSEQEYPRKCCDDINDSTHSDLGVVNDTEKLDSEGFYWV